MPSTAGAVDATPTRRILHLTYVDFNGKARTDSYPISVADTDAEINAVVAAMGDATNANLWKVSYTNEFVTGVGLASEALDAPDDSVADNIVLLLKNAALESLDVFIPAPLSAMIIDGSEDVDASNTVLQDLETAILAMYNGWSVYSRRYTERRSKNRAKRA